MSWDSKVQIFRMKKDNLEVSRNSHENRLWSFKTHKIVSSELLTIMWVIKDHCRFSWDKENSARILATKISWSLMASKA